MTASIAEALEALERVAARIEAMERPFVQRQADAALLRAEVKATIDDLDRMIGAASDA